MSDTDSDFETSSHLSAQSSDSSATVTRDRETKVVDVFHFVEEAHAVQKGGWLKNSNDDIGSVSGIPTTFDHPAHDQSNDRNSNNNPDDSFGSSSESGISSQASGPDDSASSQANLSSISETSGIGPGRKYSADDASKRFLHYTLTGHLHDEGEDGWQVQIALDDYKSTAADDYQVSNDIDSVLGFGPELPYKEGIDLCIVPNIKNTLSKPVHIMRKVNVSMNQWHTFLGRSLRCFKF